MSTNKQYGRSVVIFTILISLIFSVFGCSSSNTAESEATPTPIPTAIIPTKPTYTVERGEVIEEMQFSARVAPVVQEELFFRTAGRVRGVYAEDGDFVEAGQVIADLEFLDDLERQLASDQLRLRRAEIYVENAQLALDLFKQNAPFPENVQAQAAKELADAQQAVGNGQTGLTVLSGLHITMTSHLYQTNSSYEQTFAIFHPRLHPGANSVFHSSLTTQRRGLLSLLYL